jgi:hypothetical protein
MSTALCCHSLGRRDSLRRLVDRSGRHRAGAGWRPPMIYTKSWNNIGHKWSEMRLPYIASTGHGDARTGPASRSFQRTPGTFPASTTFAALSTKDVRRRSGADRPRTLSSPSDRVTGGRRVAPHGASHRRTPPERIARAGAAPRRAVTTAVTPAGLRLGRSMCPWRALPRPLIPREAAR